MLGTRLRGALIRIRLFSESNRKIVASLPLPIAALPPSSAGALFLWDNTGHEAGGGGRSSGPSLSHSNSVYLLTDFSLVPHVLSCLLDCSVGILPLFGCLSSFLSSSSSSSTFYFSLSLSSFSWPPFSPCPSPTHPLPSRRCFGTKCAGCAQGISPSDLVRRARSKVFHLNCFTCMMCNKQLSTGEELYIIDENKFVCKEDYLSNSSVAKENSLHSGEAPIPSSVGAGGSWGKKAH